MFLAPWDTGDLLSVVSFAFTTQRHLNYSARICTIYLLLFGKVWLGSVCRVQVATPDNEPQRRIYGWWVKSPVPLLPVCGSKVHEIFRRCRRTFVLSTLLPGCLCHVSFRRYSPLSLEGVEKPNKCKSFWVPIFWKERSRLFYGRLLARFTVHRLEKFD